MYRQLFYTRAVVCDTANMIDEKFVFVGVILSLIGSISYLRAMARGVAVPNRVSWFLWAAAPLVACAAELQHGVGLPALMTFMVGFGPLLVFLGSFVTGGALWKVTKLDIACGVLSVSGLVLWQATGDGIMAIWLSIVADGLAGVPTVVKAYAQPESESWMVFFLGAASAIITLLTIDVWDFAHYGFPVYILAICSLLVVLIRFRAGVWLSTTAATVKD